MICKSCGRANELGARFRSRNRLQIQSQRQIQVQRQCAHDRAHTHARTRGIGTVWIRYRYPIHRVSEYGLKLSGQLSRSRRYSYRKVCSLPRQRHPRQEMPLVATGFPSLHRHQPASRAAHPCSRRA